MWIRLIFWRRKWQPTPVLLPGKSHGQRSLAGYSPSQRVTKSQTRLSDFTFTFFHFNKRHAKYRVRRSLMEFLAQSNIRAVLATWLSGKNPPANAGDTGSIPGSGRSPGGGHGTPLQYSCLENPMDRGAWQATVHVVVKSWSWLSKHKCTHILGYLLMFENSWWLLNFLKQN